MFVPLQPLAPVEVEALASGRIARHRRHAGRLLSEETHRILRIMLDCHVLRQFRVDCEARAAHLTRKRAFIFVRFSRRFRRWFLGIRGGHAMQLSLWHSWRGALLLRRSVLFRLSLYCRLANDRIVYRAKRERYERLAKRIDLPQRRARQCSVSPV